MIANLRRGHRYDPRTAPPADCEDAVAYFLFESRRGDDYAFASAACVLLRALGYPTRFVQGFYAAPGRFDAELGQTPVGWRDLHTWAEVLLPAHEWVVIEPTPGYDVLGPETTWWARARAAALASTRWLAGHPVGPLGLLLLGVGLIRFRREVVDAFTTVRWRLLDRGASRGGVIATLRVLERRCKLGGHPRPSGRTLRSWYTRLALETADEQQRALMDFIDLADWAEYAPPSPSEPPLRGDDDVRRCCREVVRVWTLAVIRAPRHPGGARAGRISPAAAGAAAHA